ncbi:MAG TPA: transposase [Acidimicrobiales bacterium]|nr:transposase [Acidimicrobiales bacterium]
MTTRARAFQYALRPTVKQQRLLSSLLEEQRKLYNAALEERRGVWRWERRTVTRFEQNRTLTGLAQQEPVLMAFGVTVARGTLLRLDRAFQAFMRRARAGQSPGFPRFQSSKRFRSVEWPDTSGWKLHEASGRLALHGIGDVRVLLHRPLRGSPKTITVARVGERWQVTVFCTDVEPSHLPQTNRAVGLDLGVSVAAALSDGTLVDNPRHLARSAHALATAQRVATGRQQGSRRQAKARAVVAMLHRRIGRQRKDFLHKQSRLLVNEHDVIVIEDLPVSRLVRRPQPVTDPNGGYSPNGAAAKAGLNKSILDVAWGTFRAMLTYKAEEAGRQVIAVSPRHSSQMCAGCGHVTQDNRRGTAFNCVRCGRRDHADVNAAINILRAGLAVRREREANSESAASAAISHLASH